MRLANGWVAMVVPVLVSCNLKALTVEAVKSQKKDLHLAAAGFALEQLHHDLREAAGADGQLLRRLDGDRMHAAHTEEEVLEKLKQGMQEVIEAHTAEPADRYLNHAVHRRVVGELLDARTHAFSALALYLENPSCNVVSLLRLPNATLHREYVAFLRRTLSPLKVEGGEALRREAERLCVTTGLVMATAAEKDREGLTRLMVAAADGSGPMAVDLLVAAGAAVNAAKAAETHAGWTALSYAAAAGNVPELQALCSAGADVETACTEQGSTPLIVAADYGQVAAVEALAKAGCRVNAVNWQGVTPLYKAAAGGHLEVVQALCRLDADVERASDDGMTPLMAAAEQGHLAVVQVLRDAGARGAVADFPSHTKLLHREEGGQVGGGIETFDV